MLSTLANFKEAIGANTTANDSYFNNLLTRASALLSRSIVGRILEEVEVSEFYDGSGTRDLNLRQGPIVSVSSVAAVSYDSSGNPVIETTYAADEYIPVGLRANDWKLPGYLQSNGGWKWVTGDKNYQVTYTVGWTTGSIPGELEEACILAATFAWNQRKGAGLTSRDVGDGSVSFRTREELNKELKSMLAGYMDLRY